LRLLDALPLLRSQQASPVFNLLLRDIAFPNGLSLSNGMVLLLAESSSRWQLAPTHLFEELMVVGFQY